MFKVKQKVRIVKVNDDDTENAPSVNDANDCLTICSDSEYDHYGFEKNKDLLQKNSEMNHLEKEEKEKEKEKERKQIRRRWYLYSIFVRELKNGRYLKSLIRKGIPDKLRSQIWPHLLGSMYLYLKYPNVYERCANTDLDVKVLNQIELDIIRTFPNNKNYQRNSIGLVRLKNVLHAFAIYRPKINYCQSMNFIAAVTLIFLKEDLAFWSLVQLLDADSSPDKINISEYYNSGMCGLRRDMIVIEELLKTKLPKVHVRLKELDIEISWICSEWLLCLFCTSLPITTTLRIWDCLFYEGDKIIFRVVLAIFKLNEKKIMELNSLESILLLFKEFTKNMDESEKLMNTAFYGIGALKKRQIKKLRMEAEKIIKNSVS